MPKYLGLGSYTHSGISGFLKEGGTSRRDATKALVESLGGTLEAYYFTFGEDDFVVIYDMPDNVSALSAILSGTSSGAVQVKTTVLITPEEADQAVKKSPVYRPPGQ
jgi:uncharacterized protein with GYD domain